MNAPAPRSSPPRPHPSRPKPVAVAAKDSEKTTLEVIPPDLVAPGDAPHESGIRALAPSTMRPAPPRPAARGSKSDAPGALVISAGSPANDATMSLDLGDPEVEILSRPLPAPPPLPRISEAPVAPALDDAPLAESFRPRWIVAARTVGLFVAYASIAGWRALVGVLPRVKALAVDARARVRAEWARAAEAARH